MAIGLIQPIELIKLFKPKSMTFYSFPSIQINSLSFDDFSEMLKKTYSDGIVKQFEDSAMAYNKYIFMQEEDHATSI